ncbi:MAG: hypothetical protein KAS66_13390 [Candidatus Omnitrophica bacterium]|nr:hypothetical protein [Candidatus Omnitrophota bacterium]
MKKTYIFVGLIIMLAFSWGSAGSMMPTSSAEETVYDIYEYRPLTPGSSWTYKVKGLF